MNMLLIILLLLLVFCINPVASNEFYGEHYKHKGDTSSERIHKQPLSRDISAADLVVTDSCDPNHTAVVLGGFDIDFPFACNMVNDIRTEGPLNVLDGGSATFAARFVRIDADFSVKLGGILHIDTSTGTECGSAAIDLPGNGLDDDCDGLIDNTPLACDSSVAYNTLDPADVAKTIDLCQMTTAMGNEWGVLDAHWTMPNGSTPPVNPNYQLGHGVLNAFGPNVHPQSGAKLLVLSSGTARIPGDIGYSTTLAKGYSGDHPLGFPIESPACPGIVTGNQNDAAAFEVTIRAPDNVNGYAFDSKFYTREYPDWFCSTFNDFFIALAYPAPAGAVANDVIFDQLSTPISVNATFLEVCDGCLSGPGELLGTGFEGHGATSWLQTHVPVTKGEEFTIRFAIYDSGDGTFDSSVLIDNFRWLTNASRGPFTYFIPDPL